MFWTIGFLLDISNYVWNWRGSKPVVNHSFHFILFFKFISKLLVNGSWFDSAIKQEECGNFRFQRESFGINQGILWEGWKAASCCQRWKMYILLYLFFFGSNNSVCFCSLCLLIWSLEYNFHLEISLFLAVERIKLYLPCIIK